MKPKQHTSFQHSRCTLSFEAGDVYIKAGGGGGGRGGRGYSSKFYIWRLSDNPTTYPGQVLTQPTCHPLDSDFSQLCIALFTVRQDMEGVGGIGRRDG